MLKNQAKPNKTEFLYQNEVLGAKIGKASIKEKKKKRTAINCIFPIFLLIFTNEHKHDIIQAHRHIHATPRAI